MSNLKELPSRFNSEKFDEWVTEKISAPGWNISKIAYMLKVSQSSLDKYRNGKAEPRVTFLVFLAETTNTSLEHWIVSHNFSVSCPKCGKKYNIIETKIPISGANTNCKACGERFTVYRSSKNITDDTSKKSSDIAIKNDNKLLNDIYKTEKAIEIADKYKGKRLLALDIYRIISSLEDKIFIGVQGGETALINMDQETINGKKWSIDCEKRTDNWITGGRFTEIMNKKFVKQ